MVVVTFDGRLLHFASDDGTVDIQVPADLVTISPPLGKTARVITLPGGATCETTSFSPVKELERKMNRSSRLRLVYVMESRWRIVIASAVLLCIVIGLFSFLGIPLLAKVVAHRISPASMERISTDTLAWLDSHYFTASALATERKDALQTLFTETSRHIDGSTSYRLEFRKSPYLGPNALALPSGTIVVLDELVQIVENDQELAGIFAHEVSHVKHRHALRQVIQAAGILFMLTLLTGDLTGAASITSTLPVILTQSSYSRRFELEADREAGLYLVAKGWGTKPYRDILARMSENRGLTSGTKILATHPELEKRLRFLENLGK